MIRYIRLLTLILLACCPRFIKIPIYRMLFGFKLGTNVRIGCSFIDSQNFELGDNSSIASGTIFWNCNNVLIGQNVNIGHFNFFRGGDRIELEDYSQIIRLNVINAIRTPNFVEPPNSVFKVGYGSVITSEHRIDFTDKVELGKFTVFGGRNSSIWTHNRRSGLSVHIGDYCYIGSETRFAPGTVLPSKCIVAIGSVVVDVFIAEEQMLAGVPARHVRWLNDIDKRLLYDKTRLDLPAIRCDSIPRSTIE